MQLEDRRPDARDGAVELVDPLGQRRRGLRKGLLQRATDPVEGQAGGEDPLYDVVVQVPGDPVPVGLAVRKGNTELTTRVRDGLEKLRASGEYARLLQKYNLQEPDQAQVDKILAS